MTARTQAPRIGVNTQPAVLQGSADNLAALLETYCAAGATHAEISPHGVDVIYNLRLRHVQTAAVRKVCEAARLSYSVHAPNCLNYMDSEHIDLHVQMGRVLVAFCAEIGADTMVIHAGRSEKPLPREQLAARLAQEREYLYSLADFARENGVKIAVENLNPERAFIEGRLFSYGLNPFALARQIAMIDHPFVGATLDFGHAICSCNWLDLEFEDAVRALAPYVTHFHITDAFGRPPTMAGLSWEYQAMYGMNDVDIPLGEGEVPFTRFFYEIEFERFFRENGVMVIETKPRFIPIIEQFIKTAGLYAEIFRKAQGTQDTGKSDLA